MRLRSLVLLAVLVVACAPDGLTNVDNALGLTIAQPSFARGANVLAVVTNLSDRLITGSISECRAPGPYQLRIGSDWVDRIGPDTIPCAGFIYTDTLRPNASWHYSWQAPPDTGTYRLKMVVAGHPLLSREFVVR